MACYTNNDDEQFFEDKLLLDPNEADLKELLLLLFSPDIKDREFVDCSDHFRRRGLGGRWLIFLSVLAQKTFLALEGPLSFTGNALEMWLNLLANNGGFFKLVLRFAVGNVEWPDRELNTYASAAGNLDRRVDLDGNIRPGDPKYIAMLSFMSSKLAYENEAFIKSIIKDHWHMDYLGIFRFWNEYQKRKSTEALVLQDTKSDQNMIVVAFRGTDPFDAYDWCTDVDLSWYQLEGVGKIHRGFMKALGLQRNGWPYNLNNDDDHNQEVEKEKHLYAYYEIRKLLREKLEENDKAKFVLTGHSLGGALAILFVFILALHEETWLLQKLDGVYTFGQPRVGDKQFGEFMEGVLRSCDVKYFRYVYCNDMVPRMPYDATSLYKHFGPCIYFSSCYNVKIMREEPNKNYFSMLWYLPKIMNAVWELIRSFIIPYIKGPKYRESWFMKLFRVLGLVFPGLSAHVIQDYDNCTRLGSLPLSFIQDSQQELHQD